MPDTRTWKGDVAAVAQVDKFTPANVITLDIFTLTMNGRSVSFTATADTTANVTAGLTAAWNASTTPEHTTLTAADETTHMTLTANTAGVPFTVTATTTEGGAPDTQTLTRAEVTANAGPAVFDIAANWSGDTLPIDGDYIVYEDSDSDCLYGLDQSSLTPASIQVKASYTGKIGLPRENAVGYVEYLESYLKICDAGDATNTAVTIGQGEGSGSGRLKLDLHDGQATILVYSSGTRAETGIPSLLLKGSHASNALTISKGDVGVATAAGETATLSTLAVGYTTRKPSDVDFSGGAGLTLGTLTQSGGEAEILNDVTTVTITDGELTIGEDATCGTLTVRGGKVYYQSVGTNTTLTIDAGGILDFCQDARARTFTNSSVYEGAVISDPAATVTWTNGLDLHQCGLPDVTLDLGDHLTWTPSAI